MNGLVDLSNNSSNTFEYYKDEVVNYLLMKKPELATEKVAEFLKKTFFFKSIRDDTSEEIWIYIDGIYRPNGKSYILEVCRQLFMAAYTLYLANQVIAKIHADSLIEKKDFFDQQTNYEYLIPVQNGLLDITTRELKPFSPEYYFFNKLNAKYVEDSKCPKIKKFIKSIVEKDKDVDTLQEMVGYSMMRKYLFEKGFILHGAKGRNGKSKFLSLHQYFLGIDNCSSVSLQELEKEPFSLINLHNKLVNISAELSQEAIDNTGKYKALVGGDVINANRKGQSHIQFVNYAKMIFSCNNIPLIRNADESFFGRWVVVEFPYQFLPQNEIDELEDTTNVFLRDEHILENLTSEEELNGFLIFALNGLDRLIKKRTFSNGTTASELQKYWLRNSNSVSAFILDEIDLQYDAYISKQDFKKEYHRYCVKHKLKQMSDKGIKATLSNDLGLTESYKSIALGERAYVWEGIRLKSNLLNNNYNEIINLFKDKKKLTYSDLVSLFEDIDKLQATLNVLSKEGVIFESPAGVWRLLE